VVRSPRDTPRITTAPSPRLRHDAHCSLEDDGMLRVFAESERMHLFERADGTPVGWICDRSIGLHGFADEHRAIVAAGVAWRALDAILRHQYAEWPRHEPALDRLRVVRDGWREWISDPSRSVARLLRLDEAPRGHAVRPLERLVLETRPRECLAIEFALPPAVPLGALLSAARQMDRALQEPAESARS
jgi:hypothetical protein